MTPKKARQGGDSHEVLKGGPSGEGVVSGTASGSARAPLQFKRIEEWENWFDQLGRSGQQRSADQDSEGGLTPAPTKAPTSALGSHYGQTIVRRLNEASMARVLFSSDPNVKVALANKPNQIADQHRELVLNEAVLIGAAVFLDRFVLRAGFSASADQPAQSDPQVHQQTPESSAGDQ